MVQPEMLVVGNDRGCVSGGYGGDPNVVCRHRGTRMAKGHDDPGIESCGIFIYIENFNHQRIARIDCVSDRSLGAAAVQVLR
jgi:hypothetical protein